MAAEQDRMGRKVWGCAPSRSMNLDQKQDMIDMAYEPKTNSRLSCQLIVNDDLDGLVVNIPSKQV